MYGNDICFCHRKEPKPKPDSLKSSIQSIFLTVMFGL